MQSTNVDDTNIDQLWDYNQPEESEKRFRQALAAATVHTPIYGELLTQIARAQGLQRKFAEAHQTLDEAQALLGDQPPRNWLRYLLERGRVFNSSKQPAQARPLFLEAWEQARDAGEDFYAVDAAHMLGIVEPPDQQLLWNHKALEVAEQSADPRAQQWLGSLYNNIGWTYHDLQREEEALAIFQKALAWRAARNQPRETRIAKWCVARILRALNRVEEALAIQQALLKELENASETDGYVDEELGECLLPLNRLDEAQSHFAAAYQILAQDPWLAENEAARLERLRTLGKVTQH
jgi:tetratricopeptide (TPR) repeat protein